LNKNKSIIIFFIIPFVLVIIDQLTKLHFRQLNYFESIEVIGSYLTFVHVENPGMAFGITFGPFKILLSLFSILASVALFYTLTKLKEYHFSFKLGISLIAAGATGNLIDRVFYGVFFDYAPLFYGKVVDFIQVDIPDINFLNIRFTHFPVFNVADSCVTVGVIVLLLFYTHIPQLEDIFKKNNTIK